MDWCDTDPELILTAGRDNKIICWNYIREDPLLSETALDRNILEVRWSKKLPSIYSVCTDSKVSICTLNENNLFSYVPKWYKVPVGSTFFGNDTVLTFSENRGRVLHENHLQINTQDKSELKNRLIALEDCMAGKPGS